MATLLGTLGAIGTNLLGNLFSKGAETVGNIASNKLEAWQRKSRADMNG